MLDGINPLKVIVVNRDLSLMNAIKVDNLLYVWSSARTLLLTASGSLRIETSGRNQLVAASTEHDYESQWLAIQTAFINNGQSEEPSHT
jgi:hypothetical protein